MKKLKVALITTDNRELYKRYDWSDPNFGGAPQALIEGFQDLDEEVEIHVISCLQREIDRPVLRLSSNVYYHSIVVPSWGWLKSGYLGCVLKVRNLLEEIDPDIVHGQGTERECAIVSGFSGCVNCLTIHGNMREVARKLPFSLFNFFTGILEVLALRMSDLVFCNSDYTSTCVGTHSSWKVPMPNPIRTRFLEGSVSRGDLEEPLRFLCVGGIIEYKRPLELLNHISEISDELPDFEISFLGTGKGKYYNEFMTRAHDLNERFPVRLPGFLSLEETIVEMDQADILLHWSKEEACSLVLIEGVARGLKVIASSAGGNPDVLGRFSSAVLCSSSEELKKEIINASKNFERPSSLDFDTLKRDLSPVSIAKRHLEHYRSLLRK